MKRLLLLLLTCMSLATYAQEQIVEGKVFDANTNEPLSYANISVVNSLMGTVTNDDGTFKLICAEYPDSLLISFIGYEDMIVATEGSLQKLEIALKPWVFELGEIIVKPKSPEYYIKEALKNYESNTNSEPYVTQSFFQDLEILEKNGEVGISGDEAVFMTFYTQDKDPSSVNPSKLVLHRTVNNESSLTLSDIINTAKVEKKVAKFEERMKEEGTEEERAEANDALGNGPGAVLKILQDITELHFLQEDNFEDYLFSFGEPNYYNDRELIVIIFKNEKNRRFSSNYAGEIYLDAESLAIVAINYTENAKVPYIIRPILKRMLGVNVVSMINEVNIQNQFRGDYWYPKKVIYESTVGVKKGFKKKKIGNKKIFSVERISLENLSPIDEKDIFNPKKKYENQVRNEENLKWSDINVVK